MKYAQAAIAIAFLTLGIFLLASTNLQSVVERWASAAEMSVYLRDDLDAMRQQQLVDTDYRHGRSIYFRA